MEISDIIRHNPTAAGNDIIQRLLDEVNEEFTDEEAEEFNKRIEKFESGDYSDTIKLDLDEELKKIC